MILRKMCVALIFVISLSYYVNSAKILCVLSVPLLSHQLLFRPLIDELLKRNHEIDVITADPTYAKDKAPPNVTEIDIHNVSYSAWNKYIEDGDQHSAASKTKNEAKAFINTSVNQLASKEFQDLIKSKKPYDIVIIDYSLGMTRVVAHLLSKPLIVVSTFSALIAVSEYMGIPHHPLYYPSAIRNTYYKSPFYEKYKEIYNDLIWYNTELSYLNLIGERVKRVIFPELPIHDLSNNIHMFFFNTNPVWEGIRPYPINTGLIRFPTERKQVPKDIQTYLDSTKNRVIYMSFGTGIPLSTLRKSIISSILDAFSKLNFDVLLKCDTDDLPGRPNNVKLFKFLPQPDILKHPKIKLFITHGGQNSLYEAIDAGVPVVATPYRFDQFANAERCVQHGIGVKLDFEAINEETFIDAITTVVEDKRYYENIVKVRSFLQDAPMKFMDRVIWGIEYVIRHGGSKHMTSPSANLPWAEFFELELLVYLLFITVAILIMTFKCVIAVTRLVFKASRILQRICNI